MGTEGHHTTQPYHVMRRIFEEGGAGSSKRGRNQRKKSFVKRCRGVSGAIANGL